MAGILTLDNSKVVGAEAVDLRNVSLQFSLPIAAVAATTPAQNVCSLTMPLHYANWVALSFDLDYLLPVLGTTALTSVLLTVTATSDYDPTVSRTVYSKAFTPALGELTFGTIDEPTFYPCSNANTVTYTVSVALTYIATVVDATTLLYKPTGSKVFLAEELQLDKAIIATFPA